MKLDLTKLDKSIVSKTIVDMFKTIKRGYTVVGGIKKRPLFTSLCCI